MIDWKKYRTRSFARARTFSRYSVDTPLPFEANRTRSSRLLMPVYTSSGISEQLRSSASAISVWPGVKFRMSNAPSG